MDNEYTQQSHRILYPGMNGIRTYADLLLMTSRRLPVPENHVEVSTTNGQDTLTESDTVPQQSQMTESESVPQQSRMTESDTVLQQSQMTESDTLPQLLQDPPN